MVLMVMGGPLSSRPPCRPRRSPLRGSRLGRHNSQLGVDHHDHTHFIGQTLKDMWKAHLSPLVQHLFLVVPNSINDEKGAPRSDQAFLRSTARLSSFFRDCRTEVDVLSVHVFGYGPERVRQAQVETRLPQR
jgi:hypothetical protein